MTAPDTAPGVRHAGVLLFDGVEELDAVGPWETLVLWTRLFPEAGWSVTTLAVDEQPIRCSHGLRVLADHTPATAPRWDLLVHPGGPGTRRQVLDEAHLERVRALGADVPLLASVCTGSLVLAAAGLLAGRPATTHRASLDTLAELDPSIDVRRDVPFVDDGDVVTSAGIINGIDLALHLVGRLGGPEQAARVRDALEYRE